MKIPPQKINDMLESNPLRSRILLGRLAVDESGDLRIRAGIRGFPPSASPLAAGRTPRRPPTRSSPPPPAPSRPLVVCCFCLLPVIICSCHFVCFPEHQQAFPINRSLSRHPLWTPAANLDLRDRRRLRRRPFFVRKSIEVRESTRVVFRGYPNRKWWGVLLTLVSCCPRSLHDLPP